MCWFWHICGIFLFIYTWLWYYVKRSVWCKSQTCLAGKTAIVTGANSGIGYETALDFAKRGARVILACRNKEKAETAKQNIVDATGNPNVVTKFINLASFETVRDFAKDINETEARLDILVNNAGTAGIGDKKSSDGLLLLMQINYYSSFLLTNLLLGLMKKSAPSRIVNVSSLLAKYATFDVENLNLFTSYRGVYANSKLCNILFTMSLAEKLKGTGVTAYSIHPGAVKTPIFNKIQGFSKVIIDFFKDNFFKTPEEGCQTIIQVSVAKGIENLSGRHFEQCQPIETYQTANVEGLQEKLWRKSETFTEMKPEEMEL